MQSASVANTEAARRELLSLAHRNRRSVAAEFQPSGSIRAPTYHGTFIHFFARWIYSGPSRNPLHDDVCEVSTAAGPPFFFRAFQARVGGPVKCDHRRQGVCLG